MDQQDQPDKALVIELQHTIQSLREQLEQLTRAHQKELAHQIEQNKQSELRLQQTIIQLRKEISGFQMQKVELVNQFNHRQGQLQNEKLEADKHFQSHMSEVRAQFEQRIQRLNLSNQQLQQKYDHELKDLQTQIKLLRQLLEPQSVAKHNINQNSNPNAPRVGS